jgi:hypothetical protein
MDPPLAQVPAERDTKPLHHSRGAVVRELHPNPGICGLQIVARV